VLAVLRQRFTPALVELALKAIGRHDELAPESQWKFSPQCPKVGKRHYFRGLTALTRGSGFLAAYGCRFAAGPVHWPENKS